MVIFLHAKNLSEEPLVFFVSFDVLFQNIIKLIVRHFAEVLVLKSTTIFIYVVFSFEVLSLVYVIGRILNLS